MGKAELERLLSTLDIWLIIFGIFVAVGVVGESVVGFLHWRKGNDLRAIQVTENLALQKSIAQAMARAADAELRLSEFRKSRREILAALGNVDRFIEKIKPFSGTKFDIGHAATELREQWDFLWDIEPLFHKAGWIFVEWDGPLGQGFWKRNWEMEPHIYGRANVLNVSIELSPESRARLLPAAEALASALNDIGIAAAVEPTVISSMSTNVEALHFMVGEKR